jgi:hypothetical protein
VRALVASLAFAVAGCGSPSTPGEPSDAGGPDAERADVTNCLTCGQDAAFPGDASTAELVKVKIDQICANPDGCHGIGAGNMGLSPGHEFDTMIDVTSWENPPMKRVLPFDPLESYVYLKLWCDGGIDGGCMPLSTGPSPELAQLFHDWIEAGAPTQ